MRLKLLAVLSIAALLAVAAVWPLSVAASVPTEGGIDEAAAVMSEMASVAPQQKIDDALLDAARDTPGQMVWVVVQSDRALDLARYAGHVHQFTWPAGEHVAVLQAPASALLKIAGMRGVYAVDAAGAAGTSVALAPAVDAVETSERLRAAAPWSPPAAGGTEVASGAPAVVGGSGDGTVVDGWYDVRRGHAAREAWALGYRGEGVRVAVLDFPNDFAHPDMQGTWAVLPDSSPYAGWPQTYDPNVGILVIEDQALPVERRSTRTAGNGMVELYQTSTVTETAGVSGTLYTACFQPAIYLTQSQPFVLDTPDCAYSVPGTSKGGTLRFGHHPDSSLVSRGARTDLDIPGAWAGVLLVDERAAGVYDTVYVDLDGDRDFTDEKPMTKADPLGWRDINADGLADVSGGLLYWISDGDNPFPASWLWGLEDEIPQAGHVIGIEWANGTHGTMCASNIVSQGVLKVPSDRDLTYRDLSPDGQPVSTNVGMSPAASLVSVGNVYASDATFAASWRYVVFGHDRDSRDDDIQVASNSYGFSNVDNDSWDADSRLVDHYVRTYSPSTSFLVATGNGGPGYGTTTAPKPTVAMGIAASTQMGSTGMDSITDTTQITFGDIAVFSNRGPGAEGRTGVTLAADGADASGALPINVYFDGAHSNMTWGGTSRSTPVAAGALALVYEAFETRTGRWPTWEEAKAILMAGARHAGYDTFTQGAGVLDAGDAVRVAAGERGVYAMPPEWTAGDYRGTKFAAFASVVAPGETTTGTITLHNPSPFAVKVDLSAQTLRRVASYEEDMVTSNDIESTASGSVPDYVWPIDREQIPADTELMVMRGTYPYAQFDANGDYVPDNYFTAMVLQHTDINGDGRLWDDRDGNGAVGHKSVTDTYLRITYDGTSEEIAALQGAITAQLDETGVSADMAWFGEGCDASERFQDVTGKIALIVRGTCTFQEKFINAQSGGAIGVVVYTDDRPIVAMGGEGGGVTLPGVMIENAPGVAIRDRLLAGTPVAGKMAVRRYRGVGLDGAVPTEWDQTEMQRYEYMRFNYDYYAHNNWTVSVHHPLERWADGLYGALSHSAKSTLVPTTTLAVRYDFYAYRPWEEVTLAASSVTIPARGTATVEAAVSIAADAPAGALQGAIFADFERIEPTRIFLPMTAKSFTFGARPTVSLDALAAQLISPAPGAPASGAEEELLPGGYELPHLRTVIPVNVNVAPGYDWQGAVTLGGDAAYDDDAPYNNAATTGAFNWTWGRPDSGDWRFYFLDAAPAPDNTWWLFKTTWDDPVERRSDIDTRFLGPTDDRFSDPDHPANRAEGEDDMSDPAWYGPYSLDLITRSPYLASGSIWPFDTTSGAAEDWLVAPASEGLHEVILHNVMFSGAEFDLPFASEVGSVRTSAPAAALDGAACAQFGVTPTIDLDGLQVRTYGLTADMPEVYTDVPAPQDVEGDVSSASFKRDVTIADAPAWLEVTLDGEDDDDLDLWILRDANLDGVFAYPDEVIANSAGVTGDEQVVLPGRANSGNYQVWVHGYAVSGESTFDLTIDVAAGELVTVSDVPERMPAGQTTSLEVCADATQIATTTLKASGVLVFGPGGAPTLMKVPVRWAR